ncbi:MAG: hypothetical protein L6R37_003371 [Teloschistes peruensis]|nr:MAG: hypothetical protein L6R37_003371 [Teloschistes peruensis]
MSQVTLLHFRKRDNGKWRFTYLYLCTCHATPQNSTTQLLQQLGEDSSGFLEYLGVFTDKIFRGWKIHDMVPTGPPLRLYDTVNVVVVKEEEGLPSQVSGQSTDENEKMREDSRSCDGWVMK